MKILLKESQLKKIINLLKEQENEDYYEISAEDYVFFMKAASYNSKVTEGKKFKGKPLYIIGDVNLSGTPTKSLGNVIAINGNLDISNTKIADISKTDVKGNVIDYGSERERIRIRREEMKKLAEADERREDGDWDLDNPKIDEEGLAANALFQNLVSDGDLVEMDEDTKTEIETKKQRIEELIQQGSELDLDSEERDELYEEIDILEDEIEEIQNKYADVYYVIPPNRSGRIHYFEVVGLRNQDYMVGRYDDMYEAAIENQEQLIEDVGIDGLSGWLIENNIDKERVRDYMEDFYRDDITENPDVYFNEDDYQLTDEQEDRKEKLEIEIEGLREKLKNTENEDEIAELETEIEEFQDELDSIEPDTEPTDDMIDEKVNYYLRNTDEIGWMKEMGYDLSNWVNIKGIATDIVDHDGLGSLNGYDGQYDDVTIKTTDGKSHSFIVMRTN
jgi:hypothetical protein